MRPWWVIELVDHERRRTVVAEGPDIVLEEELPEAIRQAFASRAEAVEVRRVWRG